MVIASAEGCGSIGGCCEASEPYVPPLALFCMYPYPPPYGIPPAYGRPPPYRFMGHDCRAFARAGAFIMAIDPMLGWAKPGPKPVPCMPPGTKPWLPEAFR